MKLELESMGLDAPTVEKNMKLVDCFTQLSRMQTWVAQLSRPVTQAEREKMASLILGVESLLTEDEIQNYRDSHAYADHRSAKLREVAEAPSENIDIDALSVIELEEKEMLIDDLHQQFVWKKHTELKRENPKQSQEWFGLLQYNVRKIEQALECLAEFYRIALWLKEMDRIAVPDAAKKAKADKFLDEWVNHFDERPAPGERLLPISQRLNIVINRAMEQVKKHIKFALLTPPPKEAEKKKSWKKNGRTADMLFREMWGKFEPSAEQAKAKKANEDYRALLEAQQAKIAAAKWKRENGSKPFPTDSKPKFLQGAGSIAARAAAKRGQKLRGANSPRPTEWKYFAPANRKGGRGGKGGK